MVSDEARALLIEQCARMMRARVTVYEAQRAYAEAVNTLRGHEEAVEIAALPQAEQYECFLASCRQERISHNHPALAQVRADFRDAHVEQRLSAGQENARWN